MREVAARIGAEAKRAGVHYMLGPVLNLVRSPLGGRDFEAYSEDPILAAMLGAAYVEGMQSAGVAATPKHYVANESETHRTSVDCRVDERTLREVYLVPFEAAANAGAWSIMAAYNLVNGIHCADHDHLVGEILKGEWGWDGVLMSDWHAADDTVAGAVAGLDLEMPGPPRFFGPGLAEAVRRGEVSEAVLDEKARRMLLLAARVGALAETGTAGAAPAGAARRRRAAGSREAVAPLRRAGLRAGSPRRGRVVRAADQRRDSAARAGRHPQGGGHRAQCGQALHTGRWCGAHRRPARGDPAGRAAGRSSGSGDRP